MAAVVSHELAHIRNRDTLTMTITATFAGAISMLAQFGLFFGGRSNNNSPLGGIGSLVAVIVAPIAALLVQMAVSRTREYEADHDGAQISGDPLALASALQKIAQVAHAVPNYPAEQVPAMAHMYIINPLSGAGMDNLFSTHPDVNNRVAALRKLAAAMQVGDKGGRSGPWAGASASVAPSSNWGTPVTGRDQESGHPRGPWG